MSKSINILDKDYIQWIKELSSRYRRSQIKAAVKVNEEMLRFYWELGRDIVEKKAESRWGSGFMKNLSNDLKTANPDATCFSQTNLLYMKNFYLLFPPQTEIAPQVGEQLEPACRFVQSYSPKGRARQSHHWFAHLQGERPHPSPIRLGIEQPASWHFRVRVGEVLS